MKRLISIILLSIIAVGAYSQNTIKFLGIPIDGTKKEMISKLQAKGYEYNSYQDVLTGEFNGNNVTISVQTVNNRVWRIVVVDKSFDDESNIKVRFNNLLDQFLSNKKYKLAKGEKLTDKDDISYEITVHKKRYDAAFFLADETINGDVWYMIVEEYGNYRIAIFYENQDNAANGDDL